MKIKNLEVEIANIIQRECVSGGSPLSCARAIVRSVKEGALPLIMAPEIKGQEESWGNCEGCGKPLFDSDIGKCASHDGVYVCSACLPNAQGSPGAQRSGASPC